MSKQTAALQFSLWLAKTHPTLFAQVAHQVSGGKLGALGQDFTPDLSDVSMADVQAITPADVAAPDSSSIFSSIGSGIASAVSSVGSALTNPSVINSFANVAANYYKSQATSAQAGAQKAVLQTQLARAQAGLPPAPIAYAPNGAPIYQPTAGVPIPGAIASAPTYGSPNSPLFGYGITSQGLQALQPNFFQAYGTWLLIGGGLLAAVLILPSLFSRK